ncbi:MAG TPA: hypothetical protein VNM91_10875 [Dehalococcoidia bacterium]|nr:hypothetical protein [Dehalococcoidia bacterium]
MLKSLLALILALAFAASFSVTRAQTPDDGSSAGTEVPGLTGTATTVAPMPTPGAGLTVTFRVTRQVTADGRAAGIPHGTRIALQAPSGAICAETTLDASALVRGETVTTPPLVVPPGGECGVHDRVLGIAVLFPDGVQPPALGLGGISWRAGTSLIEDILIPAPISIHAGDAAPTLPSTGSGSTGSLPVAAVGYALIVAGALVAFASALRIRAGRGR